MKTIIHVLFIITVFSFQGNPQPLAADPSTVFPNKLHHPKLVEHFYAMNNQQLSWFRDGETALLRYKLLSLLDSSKYLALDKADFHYEWMKANKDFYSLDSIAAKTADKVYTDAAISFCKAVYQGFGINDWVSYDELSPKCEKRDNDFILAGLSCVRTGNELEWLIRFLEPRGQDYLMLRQELRQRLDSSQHLQATQLVRSMNLLRWIDHFNLENYVVVNAGSAMVRYYKADTVSLQMKAVVGTAATPTPSFAGYCNAVVLYPYWNVPYSIAVKEILPIVKRDIGYLDRRGLQVINATGSIVDHHSINWSNYSARNFPFQFRQSTGCDNALGVIKFNLTDPFSVYMHDTNSKTAFFAGSRYFSHGCIRLEKPVELANEFLPGKIDTAFLEACNKDQKPVTLMLNDPVPVFVIYATAVYEADNKVHYYKDVYRLVK